MREPCHATCSLFLAVVVQRSGRGEVVGLILTPLFFVFRMMGRWCEGVLFKIKLENEIFPQTISEILCLLYPLLRACSCSDYTLMYAHIGRLAILHISNITFVHEREEGMLLNPESGPKKDFRVTVSLEP